MLYDFLLIGRCRKKSSRIDCILLCGNHNLRVYAPNAGFTVRLDRLKSRTSTFRGYPAKVHNAFNNVIGL
jgi:hypothetical protein